MSLPIPSVQTQQDILGIPTDVLIQTFADRVLVLVTQLGKVGSLVQVTTSSAAPAIPPLPPLPGSTDEPVLPEPSASIVLTPLFGAPPPALAATPEDSQTMQSIYVSQIATLVWTQDPLTAGKPVVVGLALKRALSDGPDTPRAVFMNVMKLVLAGLKIREGPPTETVA